MLEKIKLDKKVKYLFIPKNSGLKKYTEKALSDLEIDKEVIIVEKRGEDIPKLIDSFAKKEIITVGITGDDLFDEFRFGNKESKLKLINTTDWVDEKTLYGRPVLALISAKNNDKNFKSLKEMPKIGVPKKYKNTVNQYLKNIFKDKFFEKNIFYYSGGVEENILFGLYDFAVDIVYTGESLKESNLKIIDILRASDISTISCKKF